MRKTIRSLWIVIPAIAIAGMTSVSVAQSNDSDSFNDSGPFSGDRGFVYTESSRHRLADHAQCPTDLALAVAEGK
jgi:hypothetical protein